MDFQERLNEATKIEDIVAFSIEINKLYQEAGNFYDRKLRTRSLKATEKTFEKHLTEEIGKHTTNNPQRVYKYLWELHHSSGYNAIANGWLDFQFYILS